MLTAEEKEKQRKHEALHPSSGAQEILESLGIGTLHLDSGFLIVYASERAARLLHKTKGEIQGKSLDHVIPGGLADRILDGCRKASVRSAPVTGELLWREPSPRRIFYRCLRRGKGFDLFLEDITSRKKAEEEACMKERKARLALEGILDSLPVGIGILDTHMRITMINDSLAAMFGSPASKISGRPLREVAPVFAHRIEHISQSVVESGRPRFGVELESPPGDYGGPARTWISHYIPVSDNEGRTAGVAVVLQNITELKEALDALKDSEERYRLLHDTMNQGVVEFDQAHRVVAANPAAEKITGLDLGEMCGLSLQEVLSRLPEFHCEEDPQYREDHIPLQSLATQHPFRNRVVRFRHPRLGQQRWVSVDNIPRSSPGGQKPGGAFVTISDITELKDAQRLLKEAHERLEKKMRYDTTRLASAVEQAGEGIVLINPALVIEYVNPAFERFSGYHRDELVGSHIAALGEYFMGDDYQDILTRITAEQAPWTGRRKRRRKSGEIMEVDLTVSPVWDEEGAVINYVALVHDMTQEARLHEQMTEVQKIEALGRLAGGIAHELKNIFTPIVLNTETVLDDIDKDSHLHPMLEETKQAALLGNDLVKQIVAFSRRQVREKRPVDIASIVTEALAFLRSALPSTIEIHRRISEGLPRAMADPVQIKQVLINLGENAGHAMRSKGGLLDVNVARSFLNEEDALRISPDLAPGVYVRIMVRDTGEGMDDETLNCAFEPLFTTWKRAGGTGMGLAIARRIVMDHQGAITAWSRPGRGATFSILLPAIEGNAGTPRGV
ncbi:MAG: PAS domain-containing protein [Pseudomonadota bacterium]|jgi:PAS domain S-box-containing protein|nr:PAS domain-containing protein [Pseudomonadota bacterium]HON39418.1 PAS domain-containing protein [Deltaproteobacteria bacterium]HPD22533.1 PAS domain-containing protein [Deltaproteobacteria bacterium]HRV36796.1 PAS domain-containing protein [Desulfomonilia bacterium]